MATKKAGSTTRKTVAKKPLAKNNVTHTKVTTVKASDSSPVTHVKSAVTARRFGQTGTVNYTSLASCALAELVGTFILAAVWLSQGGQPVPVLFGITAVVLAVGMLSGAHLNPAISIGAWVTRRISAWRMVMYVVAQILGGMLALIVINAFVKGSAADITPQMQAAGQTAASVYHAAAVPSGKEWLVLWAELLGSVIFIFTVASNFGSRRSDLSKAFTVGLGLFTALLVAGSATATLAAQGTGLTFLNPAVAIASQVFAHTSVWTFVIYMLMPIIGGIIAFGLYDLLRVGRGPVVEKQV